MEQKKWSGFSMHPVTQDGDMKEQPLSQDGTYNYIAKVAPVASYIDVKWIIPQNRQGYYTLTIDTKSKKLTTKYHGGVKVLPAKLYLVGDATDVGYDTNRAIPFVQDVDSPNLFTVTCNLKNIVSKGDNKFKIMEQKSWFGYSIHPDSNKDEILSENNSYTERKAPATSDFQWMLPKGEDGIYKLTLDIFNKTLKAESVNTINVRSLSVIDDDKPSISITTEDQNICIRIKDINTIVSAQVFSLAGRTIASANSNGKDLIVINNLASGVYLVKVSSENGVFSQKVIIK